MKLVLCKYHYNCEFKDVCNHSTPHTIVTGESYLSGLNCILKTGGNSFHFCDCICDEKYIRNEKLKKLK
jgi:hypothetical protein